jgi:uncharacterized protein
MAINTPGVHFEKAASTDRAIAMASTSLTAFIGVKCLANTGVISITSSVEADSLIDGSDKKLGNDLLVSAVKSYFSAGGKICYIVSAESSAVDKFESSIKTALNKVTNLSLVAFPGSASMKASEHQALCSKIMAYVENRADLFFIMDCPNKEDGSSMGYGDAITYCMSLSASSYTTAYYPLVSTDGGKNFIPASGLIAAQYGITDATVGVHQPAAGAIHGALTTATSVKTVISQNIQVATLNDEKKLKLNAIRPINGYGICLWGARTLNTAEFKHLNVRRLFIFAEKSIKESLKWVVFEPNNKELWGTVERGITAFLLKLWQQGALVGNKSEEAFYVKIDEENNPASERGQGFLNIEIGLAPVHPAEFVIIKLAQATK